MRYTRHNKKTVKPVSVVKNKQDKGDINWRAKIWNSNIFSLILIVLLVLSFIKVTKEVMLRYEINQEIKHLENQLYDLQAKTEKTEKLISYLQTEEYIEAQARIKLNLSKPGEKQINLTSNGESDWEFVEEDNTPNRIKWFNYFFK